MLSSATTIGSIFLVSLATSALWAPALFVGSLAGSFRQAKKGRYSLGRLWLAALAIAALHAILAVVWYLTAPTTLASFAAALLLSLAVVAILPLLVIKASFRASFGRSLLAWSVAATTFYGITLFIGPFVGRLLVQNYVVPTNSMAPTILGVHWTASCEECGAPCYCTALVPENPWFDEIQPQMICENFHVSEPANVDRDEVGVGDRIIARLGREPQRWEMIVFRYPEEPSEEYVMRLVGLPGETITIEDGHVWADGKKLTPPAELAGIEYESRLSFQVGWGDPEKPAVLADDEYFVLGDNSQGAKDSRFWEFGAEGHSPYAVPRENLRGVVTHRYWPLERARKF